MTIVDWSTLCVCGHSIENHDSLGCFEREPDGGFCSCNGYMSQERANRLAEAKPKRAKNSRPIKH